MNILTKIKGILFDMDGVLVDAREWHYEALNKALAQFGFGISRPEQVRLYDGLPTRKKLELLTKQKGLPKEHHSKIFELKQQYTLETIESRCVPNPLHQHLLQSLRNEGYKMGVCTNSVRHTSLLMLRKTRLLPYMEFVLTNEDIQNPKPSPEIYQRGMHLLSLGPQQSLIVEDNPHGIAAARGSGAFLMTVKHPGELTLASIKKAIGRCSQPSKITVPLKDSALNL